MMGLTGRTTIAAHVALSIMRVLVGLGRRATPQIFLGWSENRQKTKEKVKENKHKIHKEAVWMM
jgi:hypothetical protein